MNRPPVAAGLYPISKKPDGRTAYLTADQLLRANEESIRLGFNHNLNLPTWKVRRKKLKYPITEAWRHIGFNGGDHDTENIRLFFFFAVRRDGRDGGMVFLDITPDMWQEIQTNPAL